MEKILSDFFVILNLFRELFLEKFWIIYLIFILRENKKFIKNFKFHLIYYVIELNSSQNVTKFLNFTQSFSNISRIIHGKNFIRFFRDFKFYFANYSWKKFWIIYLIFICEKIKNFQIFIRSIM